MRRIIPRTRGSCTNLEITRATAANASRNIHTLPLRTLLECQSISRKEAV
jgi:hypothetical protein